MRTCVFGALLAAMLASASAHASEDVIRGTARVIDGDTIALGNLRIRLWGIDAPEMGSPAGQRAKHHLTRLIGQNPVKCFPKGTDRYRRIVAQCYDSRVTVWMTGTTSDSDLQCRMVRDGHARDWPRYSGGYYARCEP